jgi:hypothetical protein
VLRKTSEAVPLQTSSSFIIPQMLHEFREIFALQHTLRDRVPNHLGVFSRYLVIGEAQVKGCQRISSRKNPGDNVMPVSPPGQAREVPAGVAAPAGKAPDASRTSYEEHIYWETRRQQRSAMRPRDYRGAGWIGFDPDALIEIPRIANAIGNAAAQSSAMTQNARGPSAP